MHEDAVLTVEQVEHVNAQATEFLNEQSLLRFVPDGRKADMVELDEVADASLSSSDHVGLEDACNKSKFKQQNKNLVPEDTKFTFLVNL